MLLHCLITHQDSKLKVQHSLSHLSKWESLESGFTKMGLGTWHVLWDMTTPHCFRRLRKEKEKQISDSHHGDIYCHQWDIRKLRSVTVQLQVSAQAELGNGPQHWWRHGKTRQRTLTPLSVCHLWSLYLSWSNKDLICQQTLRNHVEFKYLNVLISKAKCKPVNNVEKLWPQTYILLL